MRFVDYGLIAGVLAMLGVDVHTDEVGITALVFDAGQKVTHVSAAGGVEVAADRAAKLGVGVCRPELWHIAHPV